MGREDLLKKVPLFSELGKRDLERLAKIMVPRSIKAGETIIKENDQAAGFFIVTEGKAEAVRSADTANPHVLAHVRPRRFLRRDGSLRGLPAIRHGTRG